MKTYYDKTREIFYRVIERDGYFAVGFTLTSDPEGEYYPLGGHPQRADREMAELDLETLADSIGLRAVRV